MMTRFVQFRAQQLVKIARSKESLPLIKKERVHSHRLLKTKNVRGSAKAKISTTLPPPHKENLFEFEKDNLKLTLKQIFTQAVQSAFPWSEREVSLSECVNPELGDYQCNDAMQIFASMKGEIDSKFDSPREVAQVIVNNLPMNPYFTEPSVAGPGFINVRISEQYISSEIMKYKSDRNEMLDRHESLESDPEHGALRVVVDFSSPNIAKEMHVGHLRSTIIGDSICRALEYKNINTIRLNHVGDWGTQFGMLIEYLKDEKGGAVDDISELQNCYRLAKKRFDEDAEFKVRAQAAVVKLQAGDEQTFKIWNKVCEVSRKDFEAIYDVLNVKITERGESFYNSMIPAVLAELERKSIAVESDGALCIFDNSSETPLICKKRDGGFNYASTDLAAIYHRIYQEDARWIIYVTDSGQGKHFGSIFSAAKRAGWLDRDDSRVKVDHVGFGLVMGEDGKRFRTRSGDTIRLKELLNEAESRCLDELKNRNYSGISEMELRETARELGIGAIKYADLQNNLSTNYIFSFDRMLDLKGNTAVYLQYAHVRVTSVLKRSAVNITDLQVLAINFGTKEERLLAMHILKFPEVLDSFLSDLMPSRLCDYVYNLCTIFNEFYGSCKIVGSAEAESRILLCHATSLTMRRCFYILGINPLYKL
jgi:arginyl-tRNA synthetase